MRKYFLLIFLSYGQLIHAQVFLPSLIDVRGLKRVPIELENKKSGTASLFTSFVIKDLRQDTTTIGYIRFTPDYRKFSRLEFENGTSSAVLFLNRYFQRKLMDDADTARLIILLKNFFLTQEYGSAGFVSLSNVHYTSKAFLTARLLMQNGQRYFYLGDVDTVISVQKWLGKAYNQLAQATLLQMAQNGERLLNQKSGEAINCNDFLVASKLLSVNIEDCKDGFYQSYADFLSRKHVAVAYRFEDRKKLRIMKATSGADTSIIQNSWGFVENRTLYVRNGEFYIPMQASLGSYSGLGLCFTQADNVPVAGVLLQNPLTIAADIADLAIKGSVAQMEHYKLFKLNSETGLLE